jgi:hypothetical protein
LDPEEACIRQARLQELEVQFEQSIVSLKAAENAKKAGAEAQPLRLAKNLHSQRSPSQDVASPTSPQGPEFRHMEALLRDSRALPRMSTTPLGLAIENAPSLGLRGFNHALFSGQGESLDRSNVPGGAFRNSPRPTGYAVLTAFDRLLASAAPRADGLRCATATSTLNTAFAPAQISASGWTAKPNESYLLVSRCFSSQIYGMVVMSVSSQCAFFHSLGLVLQAGFRACSGARGATTSSASVGIVTGISRHFACKAPCFGRFSGSG